MRRLMFAVLTATMMSGITPASAQWIYQGQESAFGDGGIRLAATASGQFGLALRCRNEALEIVYMTPDRSFDRDTLVVANATQPKLMVRVDDAPVVTLAAEIVETNGQAVILSDIDVELVHAVRDARQRVAVVLELLGQKYHEKSFAVRGSTNATRQLISACGLAD